MRPTVSRPTWRGDFGLPIRAIWTDPETLSLIDTTDVNVFFSTIDPDGTPSNTLATTIAPGVFEQVPPTPGLDPAGDWTFRLLLSDVATGALVRVTRPAIVRNLEPIPA
ncbi:MAG: hypothetical protein AAGD14_12695 [Planctomycetota bacterium]